MVEVAKTANGYFVSNYVRNSGGFESLRCWNDCMVIESADKTELELSVALGQAILELSKQKDTHIKWEPIKHEQS